MINNYKNHFISIIVPCFNEYDSLLKLNEKLIKVMEQLKCKFEVIYIDDGSKDDTFTLLKSISKHSQMIKIIRFKRNFGQTAALMAGFDYARGDVILPIDADLQNDPRDIPKLLDKLSEGFDVVSGWRKNRKDSNLTRNFPSYLANKLISYISGVTLHDYGCTLKAYKKSVIDDVRLYGEMHRFIPIFASWSGAKVTEIPVNHYPRIHGESKYGLNRTFKVVLDLLVIKFLSSFGNKPIYLFGGFGVFFISVSLVVLTYALYLKLALNVSLIQTPLIILFCLFFLLGTFSIFIGLLSELIMRVYYESQNKKTYLLSEKINL